MRQMFPLKWIHKQRLIRLLWAEGKHDWTEPLHQTLNVLNQRPGSYRCTAVIPADVLIEMCERERFATFSAQGLKDLFRNLRGLADSMVRFHHILTESYKYEAVTDPKTTRFYGVVVTPIGTPASATLTVARSNS